MLPTLLILSKKRSDINPEALHLSVNLEKDWMKCDSEHKVVEGVTLVPTPTALDTFLPDIHTSTQQT